MQEKIVEFNTAQLAKEKGFNIPTIAGYCYKDFYADWQLSLKGALLFTNKDSNRFSAPTQALLQRWLREVHNIDISTTWATIDDKIVWHSSITKINNSSNYGKILYFNTYEKALEQALIHALKLIK